MFFGKMIWLEMVDDYYYYFLDSPLEKYIYHIGLNTFQKGSF